MKPLKSTYHIPKMDCPCEENLIRMKLQDIDFITNLDFDINKRSLSVTYNGNAEKITSALESLKLGAVLINTAKLQEPETAENPKHQRKVLWIVLGINFAFFVTEIISGIISDSMGLVADSLDMLADALVYGMSLMAVGAAITRKKKVALFSGYIQILLAVVGLVEVLRRFFGLETMPEFRTMIGVSILALIANSVCLWLLSQTKSREAHIRASVIFSANDVIINTGVIAAGLLVWWFNSVIPDLAVGIIIFLIVIRGALRILKLAA